MTPPPPEPILAVEKALRLERDLRCLGGDWKSAEVEFRPRTADTPRGFYLSNSPMEEEGEETYLGKFEPEARRSVRAIYDDVLGVDRKERAKVAFRRFADWVGRNVVGPAVGGLVKSGADKVNPWSERKKTR